MILSIYIDVGQLNEIVNLLKKSQFKWSKHALDKIDTYFFDDEIVLKNIYENGETIEQHYWYGHGEKHLIFVNSKEYGIYHVVIINTKIQGVVIKTVYLPDSTFKKDKKTRAKLNSVLWYFFTLLVNRAMRVKKGVIFMTCVFCEKSTIQEVKTDYSRNFKGKKILVRGVPANYCETCGDFYFENAIIVKIKDYVLKFVALNDDKITILDYIEINKYLIGEAV